MLSSDIATFVVALSLARDFEFAAPAATIGIVSRTGKCQGTQE